MDAELILGFAVAVIVFVISQKKVYDITNRFIGDMTDELGIPTQKGIFIHAVIAGILFYIVTFLLKKQK